MALFEEMDRVYAETKANVDAAFKTQKEVYDRDVATLEARIAELEGAKAGRFAGDPGPGRIYVGCATSGGNVTRILAHEQATGVRCAFRQYDNDGIGDLAVPNGNLAAVIKKDLAVKRLPVVSAKIGIEALAQHKYRTELIAWWSWLLTLGLPVTIMSHHEPENDWPADQKNMAKMAQHAADFRESQAWLRATLNEAIAASGQPNRNVMFAGSMMTYSWTNDGKSKFGDPEAFIPAEGVWDFCAVDHYIEANEIAIHPKLVAAAASLERKKVLVGIGELGFRPTDPAAGEKVKAVFEFMMAKNAPMFLYYDSSANSTGNGWDLVEANGGLQAFRGLLTDPRCANARI